MIRISRIVAVVRALPEEAARFTRRYGNRTPPTGR